MGLFDSFSGLGDIGNLTGGYSSYGSLNGLLGRLRGGGGSGPPPARGQVQTQQQPDPRFGPQTGPYAGLNPQQYFGTNQSPQLQQQLSQQGPFFRQNQYDPYGAGAYGLPEAYQGWSGPARNAVLASLGYTQQAQPAIDLLRKDLGTDFQSVLYGQQADVINAQSQAASRTGQQRLAQAGYGGGGVVSPFAGLQVQQENQARMGALGNAARQSILQAQQMRAEASRNYLNSIAQNMQALLTPAQMEISRQAKVPSTGGVNYIGPALGALSSGIGAYAGA